MKKTFAIIISLCLVFGSIVPVYAATEVSNSTWNSYFASMRNDLNIINSTLDDIFTVFAGQTGIMYNTVSEMMSWLTPVGSFNSSDSLTGFTFYEMMDYICYLLGYSGTAVATVYDLLSSTSSNIAGIAGNLLTFITQNHNDLNKLQQSLTNYDYRFYNREITTQEASIYAHRDLFGSTSDYPRTPWYTTPYILNNGSINNTSRNWFYGTPLGNIAVLLRQGMINDSNIYQYRWAADLTHYNDQLTTWDSQGNTLTQVPFTPESAIQGLYRYLAFAQRDIARLTYVFASDQEITAREKAQANQTSILNNFVDPNGLGSIGSNDISGMATMSSGFKSFFTTGVGSAQIFSLLSNQNTNSGWYSEDTYNKLMGISNNRFAKSSESDYPTPLLDQRMSELTSLFGGEN